MDKSALLKPRLAERDVEVPGVGTVRVRSLSRAEALSLKGKEMSAGKMERTLLALAMVNPALTEDEVKQWQDAAPAGELNAVQDAILELSGMKKEAAKSDLAGDAE
ncbi:MULTISPECIES: hypothetical protein [Actinomycetes]|uniref:Phage tail assembly protein n=2 Tax=Actinomycetes TaxID=1760 RepID=A0A5N8X7S6_9ACTN|nr:MULTISPECIES: hypothetical protein [Actinomycetes]MPY55462.1 hypothetical protein [Streptomyces acidicola]GHF30821.1 hypothetical protein GCM10017786_75930 [Amycolatopsis deserti]